MVRHHGRHVHSGSQNGFRRGRPPGCREKSPPGFTLIEILIVVIILGILAAIVVPQFGSASREAKQASVITTVQTLRSQIALFRLQHNDFLPGANPLVGSGATFDQATFWNQLTMFTDVTGATNGTRTALYEKGPYMQQIPTNPLCPTGGAGDDDCRQDAQDHDDDQDFDQREPAAGHACNSSAAAGRI